MSSLSPIISLDQWRALLAVVNSGGYAQAAASLHKSQSAITYAVQKIETLLKVKIFSLDGRRAVLTAAGQVVVRRAKTLVEEAMLLENGARAMAADWKPEIKLAVNAVVPTEQVLAGLDQFASERPETRIELYELVLSAEEALLDGRAELAIASQGLPGFRSEFLSRVTFIAVAHPKHPLHQVKRELTLRDLRRHRQLVVRDAGAERKKSGGWLEAEQRWTVTNLATSIKAVGLGVGFAWLPEGHIKGELRDGLLKPLPLKEASQRHLDLKLVCREEALDAPDLRRLADILRTTIGKESAAHHRTQ